MAAKGRRPRERTQTSPLGVVEDMRYFNLQVAERSLACGFTGLALVGAAWAVSDHGLGDQSSHAHPQRAAEVPAQETLPNLGAARVTDVVSANSTIAQPGWTVPVTITFLEPTS